MEAVPMNPNVLIFIILLLSNTVYAGIWKIEKKIVNVPEVQKNVKNFRSDLLFKSRDGKYFTYVPNDFPWDFNRSEEYVLGGKTYFLTYWFVGAQSMRFRVFNPDLSEKPICEFHSDLNKTKIKLGRKGVEILISNLKKDHVYEDKWMACETR
jgi:hypothetical protein